MNRVRVLLPLTAGLALGACAVVGPAAARACSIDGKPTVSANGQRAVLTHLAFTQQTASSWALFTFRSRYRAGTPIALKEDSLSLSKVLPLEALGHPWRWQFGDKLQSVGMVVAHRYARPGIYRIVVSAYYPSFHQYFPFDTVRIKVG